MICPFLFCFCGYEKLCFLKFLLTFLIIEFSEGNPPPSAKNKWAAQAFLCSDICPSFKKWGQFVRRQLKHVFRIEASKVSPSCLSKFAFFFCHPHATKEKTCLKKKKKILNFFQTPSIHLGGVLGPSPPPWGTLTSARPRIDFRAFISKD